MTTTSNPAVRIAEGLFCLNEENPGSGLKHYSYLLLHPQGNLLFHPLKKTAVLKRHESWLAEHGGIKLLMLTHDAEASASCDWLNQRFGAELYFHSSDSRHVTHKTRCPIAHAFSSGHQVFQGLDAIPLTGHTLGFTAYKLLTPGETFLFTGDFLSPANEAWVAKVHKLLMPVGIANLNALKDLEFDAMLPNMSKGQATPPFRLTASQRVVAIDSAVSKLTKKSKVKGR